MVESDAPSAESVNVEASEPSIYDSSVFEDEEERIIDNSSSHRPLLSDSTSSHLTASQNSVALSAQYFLSNQAKLPKGVENIRPHLVRFQFEFTIMLHSPVFFHPINVI